MEWVSYIYLLHSVNIDYAKVRHRQEELAEEGGP